MRYKQHVTKSLVGMGFKFHFLQKAYKNDDWEKRYEFVWALDSDIDLSKAWCCFKNNKFDPRASQIIFIVVFFVHIICEALKMSRDVCVQADLQEFLDMARQIDSSIVGPTFTAKGDQESLVQDGSSRVIRREGQVWRNWMDNGP